MIVGNSKVKQRASIAFDLHASPVEIFGGLYVTVLEFCGTLLEAE
jgi:hypothetical protein